MQIVPCHAAKQIAWQLPVETQNTGCGYFRDLKLQWVQYHYLWNVVHSNSNCHDWSYACEGRESYLHSTNIFGHGTLCRSWFYRLASIASMGCARHAWLTASGVI